MENKFADRKTLLVIGGGISGITAALEAAEVGFNVVIVEKEAFLGGRVVRMYQYFPKNCPPTCGMEVNFKRIRNNPRVKFFTLSEVEKIEGEPGNYKVTILTKPRYVTDKLSQGNPCINMVTSEIDDPFNLGLSKTKALNLPHDMAFPFRHVLVPNALTEDEKNKLKEACKNGEIDFDMKPERTEINVGAIVVATGWQPYDAKNLDSLGYGKYKNVITNIIMERLASRRGPTEGKILRPADSKPAQNIAFVQCAGSRDENHLPYCSAVCCMASMKQARYVKEKNPDAKITIFYIDIRVIGRHEKYYYDLLEDQNVRFIKGKVGKITADGASGDLILDVEDTLGGKKLNEKFDFVVLATGMVPSIKDTKLPGSFKYDAYGFLDPANVSKGIFPVGVARRPEDVSRATKDATSAVLKAIPFL
ncbi:CoB--CoM heterodisulfide reductase iron-sulfur subunit A family protein [bacterium]|nr:CoB--CoM heterodisulfide reductase iron-sulfur subunit A family protein [bacterium]